MLGPDEDANLVGMWWYGEGPFHREFKEAIEIRKKSHFVIRSGDVIYNKLFAWKGSFAIVPDELDGMFVSDKFSIDDIVEEYLKITVEFRDLRAEYPERDVLGGIYFQEKKIAIDLSLVPEDFPAMRGRYRFTLAHELGHWRLHRHLYLRRAGERTLLSNLPARPDHVLRSGDSD